MRNKALCQAWGEHWHQLFIHERFGRLTVLNIRSETYRNIGLGRYSRKTLVSLDRDDITTMGPFELRQPRQEPGGSKGFRGGDDHFIWSSILSRGVDSNRKLPEGLGGNAAQALSCGGETQFHPATFDEVNTYPCFKLAEMAVNNRWAEAEESRCSPDTARFENGRQDP